ncbi:hypothetical protein FB451DRAFT_1300032 [Mycena latifolia]|nr:hypothetical protein FB451DRAFT_1300032 [Mycena latifolia]
MAAATISQCQTIPRSPPQPSAAAPPRRRCRSPNGVPFFEGRTLMLVPPLNSSTLANHRPPRCAAQARCVPPPSPATFRSRCTVSAQTPHAAPLSTHAPHPPRWSSPAPPPAAVCRRRRTWPQEALASAHPEGGGCPRGGGALATRRATFGRAESCAGIADVFRVLARYLCTVSFHLRFFSLGSV